MEKGLILLVTCIEELSLEYLKALFASTVQTVLVTGVLLSH